MASSVNQSLQSGASQALGGLEAFQFKKNESLRELAKIAEEVGLPNWASSPKKIDDGRQEYFPLARKRVLEIAANPEVRCDAFELLKRLFELDPMTEKTVVDLELDIEKLSEYVEKARGLGTSEVKKLVAAYAAGVECFLSHLGFGHILGVSEEVKAAFFKAPNLLCKLNKGNDLELDLEIKYAIEGIKRLRSDEALHAFLPTAKSLVKLAGSLVVFDNAGIESAALDLLSQGEKEVNSSYKKWHEAVYVIRHLGRKVLYSRSSVEHIDRLSQFVFEEIQKKHGLFKSGCPWQVFVTAAHMYEHVLIHCREEAPPVYEQALKADPTHPGLLALLSLQKESNKPQKAIEGVSQVIERLIECLGNREIEKSPQKFILLEEAWKRAIASSGAELKGRMESLLEEQAKLRRSQDPRSQEKLQQVRMALQEVVEEKTRLEQISLDVATALQLEDEEKLAKAKNVLSAQEVMQQAVEAHTLSEERLYELRKERSLDDYDMFGFLMIDPVRTPSGFVYSREGIEQWLKNNPTDPITRTPLLLEQLKEDRGVKERVLAKQKECALSSQRSFVGQEFAVHAQLFFAVKEANLNKISTAIRKGAHPAYYKEPGTRNRALHLAAKSLPIEIFQQLLWLSDPKSLRCENSKGETPISIAMARGVAHQEMLHQMRSTVIPSKYGEEFHDAAEAGSIKDLEYLLDQGQPVDQTIKGWTALDLAASERKWEAVCLLAESGANVQINGMHEWLTEVAGAGDLEKVDRFLKWGVDPNGIEEINPHITRHYGSRRHSRSGYHYRREDYLDPSSRDKSTIYKDGSFYEDDPLYDFNPFHLNPSSVERPLVKALLNNHFIVAELLINCGADINVVSPLTGMNPFHQAIIEKNIDKVQFLLKFHPSTTIITFQGENAIDLGLNSIVSEEMRRSAFSQFKKPLSPLPVGLQTIVEDDESFSRVDRLDIRKNLHFDPSKKG